MMIYAGVVIIALKKKMTECLCAIGFLNPIILFVSGFAAGAYDENSITHKVLYVIYFLSMLTLMPSLVASVEAEIIEDEKQKRKKEEKNE